MNIELNHKIKYKIINYKKTTDLLKSQEETNFKLNKQCEELTKYSNEENVLMKDSLNEIKNLDMNQKEQMRYHLELIDKENDDFLQFTSWYNEERKRKVKELNKLKIEEKS